MDTYDREPYTALESQSEDGDMLQLISLIDKHGKNSQEILKFLEQYFEKCDRKRDAMTKLEALSGRSGVIYSLRSELSKAKMCIHTHSTAEVLESLLVTLGITYNVLNNKNLPDEEVVEVEDFLHELEGLIAELDKLS